MSPPATPKMAPDAPALTTSGWTSRLATLPPTPLSRYSVRNARDPNTASAARPTVNSAHMLNARWRKPKCTNIEVTSRHHWPCNVRGPKSAPQCRTCSTSLNEMPEATIVPNTRMFRPRSVKVAHDRDSAEDCEIESLIKVKLKRDNHSLSKASSAQYCVARCARRC